MGKSDGVYTVEKAETGKGVTGAIAVSVGEAISSFGRSKAPRGSWSLFSPLAVCLLAYVRHCVSVVSRSVSPRLVYMVEG